MITNVDTLPASDFWNLRERIKPYRQGTTIGQPHAERFRGRIAKVIAIIGPCPRQCTNCDRRDHHLLWDSGGPRVVIVECKHCNLHIHTDPDDPDIPDY